MSSLDSIIEEVQFLINNEDDDSTIENIYKLLFDYYTSSEVINDFEQAVKQLDGTTLTENYQWLLFNSFRIITDNTFYDNELRDKLCQFWLPIYQSMFEQLLSKETSIGQRKHTDHLPLNTIKYLITNMIQMQQTSENMNLFIKQETQFQNFAQKDEYFQIIQTLSSLVINPDIIERLENTDHTKIKLEWEPNHPSNTTDITPTFILWIIFKLILMFIETDGDSLTMIKHDENIKNILLKSIELISNNNPIKLSIYVILAFLLNEDNIKNEIDLTKDIIIALSTNIKKYAESNDEDTNSKDEYSGLLTNGVYIIDILIALKAFLQHDQVKNVFIENNGLELLIDFIMVASESLPIDSVKSDDIVDEFKSGLKLKSVEKTENNKKFVTQYSDDANKDVLEIITEARLLTLECLVALSFNKEAVEILKKNQEFMSEIRKLSTDVSTTSTINERLKKVIDGLFWKLEKEEEFKKQQRQIEMTKLNEEFDLMISYSWNDQPLVHNIYKYLTERYSYRIWLSENQIAPSLCLTTAQAVEKSRFILMCMSETYKGSEYCRNEAEYARDRKKTIIPLIMKPVECDGWLESISANKIYIDFTKQEFQKTMHLLRAEIKRQQREKENSQPGIQRRKRSAPVISFSISQPTAPSVPVTKKSSFRSNIRVNAYKKIPIELWSEQHVQDFLYDNKLDVMIFLTENMNGEELHQLLGICQTEHERWIMFDRLNQELEKRYQQTFPLSVYLRFLNRIEKYTNISAF